MERIVANVNLDGLAILYPFRQMVALGAEHSTLDSTVARAHQHAAGARKRGICSGTNPAESQTSPPTTGSDAHAVD